MEVDTLGEFRQGQGLRLAAAGEELAHLVAVGDLQGAGELAVEGVLHDHVQHRAALVHHGVELRLDTVLAVAHRQAADQPGGGGEDDVAPWGGGDVRAPGPEQGHVPHHDLAADTEAPGQGGGADGLIGAG